MREHQTKVKLTNFREIALLPPESHLLYLEVGTKVVTEQLNLS